MLSCFKIRLPGDIAAETSMSTVPNYALRHVGNYPAGQVEDRAGVGVCILDNSLEKMGDAARDSGIAGSSLVASAHPLCCENV